MTNKNINVNYSQEHKEKIINDYHKKYILFSCKGITTKLNSNGDEKKQIINMPVGWSNYEKDNIEKFKLTDECFIIKTGQASNLTVLDFDNIDEYNRLVLKFPELLKLYRVETNKGYHIYFLYNDKFPSGIDSFTNYKNIDILSNGKCALCSPTIYTKLNGDTVLYRIISGIIDVIPDYIINELQFKKNKITDDIIKQNKYNLSTDEKIDIIEKCLSCLSDDRYDEFDDWRNVGLIISNELSVDGYDIFNEWSSNSEKYNESAVKTFYNNIKSLEGGLSIGSLKKMAKEDDEENYNILFKKSSKKSSKNNEFNFDEPITTTSIAKHFKLLYHDKFIYSNNKLYNFNGIFWDAEEKGQLTIINNFIGNEYFNKLMSLFRNYEGEQQLIKRNDSERNSFIERMNAIRGNIYNLQNFDKRVKVIQELICHLTDKNIKFDEDPYLFGFNNKIFDLKLGTFIEPIATQYISLTCGYDYDETTDQTDKIIEYHKLLDTIFPQPEIKNLYLTILSTGLDGIPLEKFILANGGGGNGKGLLNEHVQYMLGNYSYVLPVNILLGPLKTGSNPEIANMNNKRLVIAREPDKNLMFNCATIKEISGGSELNARLNHSNDTKVNLKLTFLLECNEKPKLNEVNDALQRRIIDIPFKNKFVDKQQYDELDEDEKKTTYLINTFYKEKKFKDDYKQALFIILSDHYKVFHQNKRVLPMTNEIIKRNNDYLAGSDELLSWVNNNYEKTNNSNDKIKLKDVYNKFIKSEYFHNLNKKDKRLNNYKCFTEKLMTNMFLKKYVKENSSKAVELLYHVKSVDKEIYDADDTDTEEN
jgi:phage/plasmid-associated DNA primase